MPELFISCAKEDEESVAKPLRAALQEAGVSVGSNLTLDLGDSLQEVIEEGLKQADYGAVLLSPSFFAKGWTRYDLDALTTRVMATNRVVPVWHHVTAEQVARHLPELADQSVAIVDGDDEQMEATVQQILMHVRQPEESALHQQLARVFSMSELQDIAFRFRIEKEAQSKLDLARQVVTDVNRHGRLPELLEFLTVVRPQTDWPARQARMTKSMYKFSL
jgi:hypothetical protein